MTNKEKIIYFLTENKEMTQGELAIALYGDRKKMPYLYSALMELVDGGYVTRTGEHPAYYTLSGTEIVFPEKKNTERTPIVTTNRIIPEPSEEQVKYWLARWDELEDYTIQEEAINELFAGNYSSNKELKNIMIKCSILNDFYSTNIFKIYPVACRILELDIDDRLLKGDITLVNEIANVIIINVKINVPKVCR